MPQYEADVMRIPAVQNFNGSRFSVVLPVAGLLTETISELQPDIVHSHHPYLLGMTALRVARFHKLPLVFTHHTRYEDYTHYVSGDSDTFTLVTEMATQYANLCDQVFAPSESIAALLQDRGVTAPIAVVPTGIEEERFAHGNGQRFREAIGIPGDALVVGHLGRLAPEKNLEFLAEAVAAFLKTEPRAHFLVVGKGPRKTIFWLYLPVWVSPPVYTLADPGTITAGRRLSRHEYICFRLRKRNPGFGIGRSHDGGLAGGGSGCPRCAGSRQGRLRWPAAYR